MSKIGKLPVQIPAGVEVTINGNELKVKGPKGELSYTLVKGVKAEVTENVISVSVESSDLANLWGLTRTLAANMVEGVTKWYEKSLLVLGVGYSAKMQGSDLVLQLWFSHPVVFKVDSRVTVGVDKDPKGNTLIKVEGIDKQVVGEVAAKIRSLKKPDPYKGKGIRYTYEIVKLRPGKAAK